MKIKQLFLLSWKKVWIILATGLISIILHNLISGLIGTEEPFFFLLAVLFIPAYFIIAIPLTLINSVRK